MSPSPTARQRLRLDLARYRLYREGGFLQKAKTVAATEALWVTIVYRFGQYLSSEAPAAVRALLGLPCKILLRVLQLVTGIHIDPPTQIGPGLFIGHHGGIWISPAAVLGSNCNIAQGVTIGRAGRIPRPAPVLGDRVWVGPNATISGPVRVGNGAVVAANSLVVASVPDNGVVIGVPARVMSYSGSWELDRRARLRLIAGSPGCERADSDRRFRVPGAVQSGGRSATAGCGKRPGGRPGGEPLASEVVTD